MTTYVLRNGKLVEKHLAAPLETASRPQRHISDVMAETWHPATGRYSSSKSGFRQMTRDAGCREVGNDVSVRPKRAPIKLDKPSRVEAIKKAIYQLQQGR